jgi:protocatechuate 3,4-dioxygenase beta subunit
VKRAPVLWESLSRRQALRGLGLTALALAACTVVDDGSEGEGEGEGEGEEGEGEGETTIDPTAWANGGTAVMAALATYGDLFVDDDGACALQCATTEGPCTAPSAEVRQDISEGEPGIPIALAFRVVAADGCTPVAGAEVEIWHTNYEGLYSGDDVESGDFCTSGNARAIAAYWFRGIQVADADGKVTFLTCFPGWYSSRAIHIHFVVRVDGAETIVSQVFFPEDITAGIFNNITPYQPFGQPDTSLASDSVIGGETDLSGSLLNVKQMSDGVMVATKTIAISDAASCSAAGGGGGGGPPP